MIELIMIAFVVVELVGMVTDKWRQVPGWHEKPVDIRRRRAPSLESWRKATNHVQRRDEL